MAKVKRQHFSLSRVLVCGSASAKVERQEWDIQPAGSFGELLGPRFLGSKLCWKYSLEANSPICQNLKLQKCSGFELGSPCFLISTPCYLNKIGMSLSRKIFNVLSWRGLHPPIRTCNLTKFWFLGYQLSSTELLPVSMARGVL